MNDQARAGTMPTNRIRPQNLIAELKEVIDETSTTKRFFFRITDQRHFDFIPGQFVILELPIHEKKARRLRSYSIASPPTGDPVFELVIVRKEGGAGTRYLFDEARPGTKIPFKGPAGKFYLPEKPEREICFICTGTGVAPFRSMLQYMRLNNIPHPPMNLVFGTRLADNILYFEEMLKLEDELKEFHYIPVLSREKGIDWKGKTGYVHPIYTELYKDRRPADFYLCGWQEMINDARKNLAGLGYSKEYIHFESYG